jgi:ureidoacrylate peracid hydrolase
MSRGIVAPINGFTTELRGLSVPVIWVLHANTRIGSRSDWELFFNTIVADEIRETTLTNLPSSARAPTRSLLNLPFATA